ncbi:NADPH-dependent FMN reductase [Yinghuangia seranimata]|uniref:NADPH-dependent FMN reductase n=1 Tax=Yinghuangia seranimata TaxID=408067 RepID=UPI00248C479C|nr:NADPH-dependent FMN reductase [Yinghuangia seranimata]MDI2131989.1 NADPH-dependent FMN reductase [Yinghuangia seranimata]
MDEPVRILMISGSLRAGSASTTLLQTVPEVVDPAAVEARMYFGLGGLPHFNPDDDFDPLHPAVAELRDMIGEADALLFSTPEYAGSLPGSFKNLLDWTVGDTRISDKPTAWINCAAPGRAEPTYATLRNVLNYTGAGIVEEACVRIPVSRAAIDTEAGTVSDPVAREGLAEAVEILARYAREARSE